MGSGGLKGSGACKVLQTSQQSYTLPPPFYSSSLHIPCLCLRKSSLTALSCPLVKFPGDVAFLTLADADVQLVRAQLQGHPLPRAEVNSVAALGIILLFPLKCLMLISTFPWPAGMSHQPPGTKICIVSRCKSPFRSPKCWKEKGTVVRSGDAPILLLMGPACRGSRPGQG